MSDPTILVLSSLADGEKHGYAMMEDIQRFAGIRLGVGRAVKGMINGEMLIAFVGLGALAQRYGAQFDAAKVFAIAMVVLIIGLVSNALVQMLDNRLTRWAG